MKKIIILTLTFFVINNVLAQKEKIIYVNKHNNSFLIFNEPIKEGYMGSTNFLFIFDKKSNAKIAILKAVDVGRKTNLLVTTKKGLIFSYIVKYKEDLEKFNYIINNNDAINYTLNKIDNLIIVKNSEPIIEQEDSIINNLKEKELLNFSKKLVEKKPFYMKTRTSKNGILFQLYDIVYNNDKLYLSFLIENKTEVNYDLDYMIYQKTIKSKKKRANYQEIDTKPIFIFNKPNLIEGNTKKRFVLVFKKFTIRKKVFLITLKEKEGERDLTISISSKQLNQPN